MKARTALPALVAAVPVLALTAALPWANRLEPLVLGMPFLLAWILGWVLATPLFLAAAYVVGGHAAGAQAGDVPSDGEGP